MKTSKEELAKKMALNPSEVSAFGEETLNEMAMEATEGGANEAGGIVDEINIPCKETTNNCSGGNCAAGCGSNPGTPSLPSTPQERILLP